MRALPRAAQLYIGFVYLIGAVTVAAAYVAKPLPSQARPWELFFFLFLALLAGGKQIRFHYHKIGSISVSLGFAVTFAAMLRFGPAGALLAGVAGGLTASFLPKRQPLYQLLFNVLLAAAEGWTAGLVFLHINGGTLSLQRLPTIPAVLTSSAVFYLLNTLGVSILIFLSLCQPLIIVWRQNLAALAFSYFAGACISALAMVLGGPNAGVTLFLVTPAACLAYQSYTRHTAHLAEKQKQVEELQKSQIMLTDLYLATIKSLALAIDAKDQYSHQHILRVQRYAIAIANELGLTGNELEGLNTGALLHDIGKLGIPEHVLLKPGLLTDEEYDKIKKHPEIGAALLDPVDFPWPVLSVVKYHHEKWDGSGYPSGLKGQDIPLTARILTVADVYDALTSIRPYREAWTHEQAIQLIKDGSGTQFDPEVTSVFLSVIDEVAAEMSLEPKEWHVIRSVAGPPASTPKADQAAQAIHRASSELWALYEVAQTLSSSLGLRETLEILVNKLEVILPGTACLILLKQEDTDELTVRAAVGVNHSFFLGASTSGASACSQQVASSREAYLGEYVADDLALLEKPEGTWVSLKSSVIVPVVHQGNVLGTINLYHPLADQLTRHDLSLLETIAKRVAMALNNALLFDRTCSQAMTDPLTGLFNLRHFTASVEERCRLGSKETNDPGRRQPSSVPHFALLCLDLDSFKPINDNFGHHKGDEVLQDLAKIFRASVREEDIVARYGGDEFLIILHGAGPEEAAAMAGRIQDEVRQYDPGLMHEKLGALRLDVSIGWGCFPKDGQDCAALLSAADSQMYNDKMERKLGQLVDRKQSVSDEPPLFLAA